MLRNLVLSLLVSSALFSQSSPPLLLEVGAKYDPNSIEWHSEGPLGPNDPISPDRMDVSFRVHKEPGWWVILLIRASVLPDETGASPAQLAMMTTYSMQDVVWPVTGSDFPGFTLDPTSTTDIIMDPALLKTFYLDRFTGSAEAIKQWSQPILTSENAPTASDPASVDWVTAPSWQTAAMTAHSEVWKEPTSFPVGSTDGFHLAGLIDKAIQIQTDDQIHCIDAADFATASDQGWLTLQVQPIAFRADASVLTVTSDPLTMTGIPPGSQGQPPRILAGPGVIIRLPSYKPTRCVNAESIPIGTHSSIIEMEVFGLTDESTIGFPTSTGFIQKPLLKIGPNLGRTRVPVNAISGYFTLTNAFGTSYVTDLAPADQWLMYFTLAQ